MRLAWVRRARFWCIKLLQRRINRIDGQTWCMARRVGLVVSVQQVAWMRRRAGRLLSFRQIVTNCNRGNSDAARRSYVGKRNNHPFTQRRLMMKKAINGTTITFTFECDVPPLTFDAARTSAAVREHAIMHGFLQRLGDAAAIPKTEENGYTVTETMRREAVAELAAHYESGTESWNLRATSGRAAKQNPAIVALAAALGKTYAEAEAHIANLAIEALTKGE